MKITKEIPSFTPVVITLETKKEKEIMEHIMSYLEDYPGAIYPEERHAAISEEQIRKFASQLFRET